MGRCKFLQQWLEKEDSSGYKISVWAKQHGERDILCSFCETVISTAKGFYAIKQHFETEKHKANQLRHLDKNQSRLAPNVGKGSASNLYYAIDSSYRAELIWCMQIVAANAPANFCQGIGDVFRSMFPSPGAVPDGFRLNPTKVRYMVSDALGPYFRSKFLKEIGNEFYSILYDETTNNAGMKELQIAARYWSSEQQMIVTHHLETFFMGHATADMIKENILLAINNAGLSLGKLLMLGSDGPNVNRKVFTLVNEEVKIVREKGLIDMGFCSIHLVHNAFQKGLEVLGRDASELITSIFRYFDDWPSRWEDFQEILSANGLPKLHFLKHVSSRWLTIEPSARRLLDHWEAVIEYFFKFVPSKQASLMKTHSYRQVVEFLRKKTIKAELKFVCSSSSLFSDFLELYQRDEPLIHLLYKHLKEVVVKLMARSCSEETIESFKRSPTEHAFSSGNLLCWKDMPVTNELLSLTAHLSKSEKEQFILQMQKHYVAAGSYILKKMMINSQVLKSFGCLASKQNSQKQLKGMLSYLPVECDNEKLLIEWTLLQLEDVKKDGRIDHYWSTVFQLKAANGERKYANVMTIVKAALSLSHGNGEVERGFSRSANVLTENRASMSVRTLNARLNVIAGLKSFGNKPQAVPITEDLLKRARVAYKSYNEYLEQEKKKAEEKQLKKESEEKARFLEEERKANFQGKKQSIDKLEDQLKTVKGKETQQISAVDQLLDEANKKLQAAIRKNDLVAAQVAQSMLEGAIKNSEECKKKRKAASDLEKRINTEKDSVITSFFSKKPKL